MRILLFSLLVLLTLSDCKKQQITYVTEGVITDNSFSQPLAGATVSLYKASGNNFTQGALIASQTTGSDGKFRFEFQRDKTEAYIITVEKNNYFNLSNSFTQEALDTKNTNVKNMSVYAKSWVKLRFINIDPQPGDELQFIKQAGKENCSECCPASQQHLYGAVDTAIYCINDGNTTYSCYYWVLNTQNNGPLSTVTVPFDTTEIVLNY